MKKRLVVQLFSCFIFCHSICGEETIKDVYLKAPNLSDENIIGYNVGVRPFRKSGIRVESEYLNDKLVIHNYGYGGSGLTLCWGGAAEVSDLLNRNLPKESSKTVAILGAGVIGLSTAYELMNKGYTVHIYSEDFIPNLTSNVAAGIWSPPDILETHTQEQKELAARLLDISTKRFKENATSTSPEFAGVTYLDGYSFKAKEAEANKPEHFTRIKAEHEIVRAHFDNGVTKIGKKRRILSIDGKLFIEDLEGKVLAKGALVVQKHFETVEDLIALPEQTIINCTSLGSRELFNDADFAPVRGHLVYMKKQEGVDYLLYQNVPQLEEYWVNFYPWSDRLIIGGVFEEGKDERLIEQQVIETLLDNARKCISGES